MKIYTRTGDEGTTGLFGGGRVPKHHPRIEAYGTVDEANSAVGVARAFLTPDGEAVLLDEMLTRVQRSLFTLGADLATPPDSRATSPRIEAGEVDWLEGCIDRLEEDLAPLRHFILPGGTPAGAHLHVARTVCRRAERLVTALTASEDVAAMTVVYLNRLSDFLFVAARWINAQSGVAETTWSGTDD